MLLHPDDSALKVRDDGKEYPRNVSLKHSKNELKSSTELKKIRVDILSKKSMCCVAEMSKMKMLT